MIGKSHGFKYPEDCTVEATDNPKTAYVTSKSAFDMSDLEKLHLSLGGFHSTSVNALATLSIECLSPTTGEVVAHSDKINWAYTSGLGGNVPVDEVVMNVGSLKGEYLLRIVVTCWNKKNYLSVDIKLNSPIKFWGTME